MTKAWIFGVSVLLAFLLVWVSLVKMGIYSQFMANFLWLAPGFAAFTAALLAPSRKFLLGVSMGIPAALLGIAFNWAWQLSGNAVDFPGFEGGFVLFALILLGATVTACFGALAAIIVNRHPT
jgi:hypothetical protein